MEPQTCGPDAKVCAVSWTGGKDCNLALLDAWRDPSLRVTALVVFAPKAAAFKAHPMPLMRAQAASLRLPLLNVEVGPDPSYKESYVAGMRGLREKHGVRVVATGDMDLVGTMARNWIEECGEEAGVEAYLPLWQANRGQCLARLLAEGFEVVFSCVKSPWFDEAWVGRRLDEATIQEMRALERDRGLDLGGERGEYHTMCLSGPLYTAPVRLAGVSANRLERQRGQPDEQSWWALQADVEG